MSLYSILDVKAGKFVPPFKAESDEDAIRGFIVGIQNAPANSLHRMFPEDFTLFSVGDYDIDSGLLLPKEPERLISGLEVVQMLKDTREDCCVHLVSNSSQDNEVIKEQSEGVPVCQ